MLQRTYLRPGTSDVSPGFPLASRLPRLLPFIFFQIMLFLAMFQIYKVVRKTFIARAENVAFGNARDVLHFESWRHLDFQLQFQSWVFSQPVWVIRLFNQFYANYMYVFYACMVIAMFFAVEQWRYM